MTGPVTVTQADWEDCQECNGTGTAELICGYERPCDACHGKGERPARKDRAMSEYAKAIREAIEETVAQFGAAYVRTLSWFPSARQKGRSDG